MGGFRFKVVLPDGSVYLTTTLAEAQAIDTRGRRQRGGKARNPYTSKFTPEGGKFVQYGYSKEDVAARHAKKAQKVEALRHKEQSLRSAVKRDVRGDDLPALVVGLILETYERPGNTRSAKEGHFGVTGWLCRHLDASGKRAVIEYVAKSGVLQRKTIRDPYLVAALSRRKQHCDKDGTRLLPVSASAVNRYLREYGVSAKDLRTFGANSEMASELKRARRHGPRLDTLKLGDVKKTLKAEFNAALGIVAGKLGHTTNVLRKQYLVATVEPLYLETGAVVSTFA